MFERKQKEVENVCRESRSKLQKNRAERKVKLNFCRVAGGGEAIKDNRPISSDQQN